MFRRLVLVAAGVTLVAGAILAAADATLVLKSGEHKDQLDLKKKCITPLINIARLYALEAGVPETSTLGRIAGLRERHPVMRQFADELEQAFEFFLLLRIHHQFDQIRAGQAPDNFTCDKYLDSAPTVGLIDISLSLTTISICVWRWPMSLSASSERPLINAASPTTTATPPARAVSRRGCAWARPVA